MSGEKEFIQQGNFLFSTQVKAKEYACQKCGIRYDTAEHMEQHVEEAHPDIDVVVKKEVEEEATAFVVVDCENDESLTLNDNQQVVQVEQSAKQSLMQLVKPNESSAQSGTDEGYNPPEVDGKISMSVEKGTQKRNDGLIQLANVTQSKRIKANIKLEIDDNVIDIISPNVSNDAHLDAVSVSSASVSGHENETYAQQALKNYSFVQDGDTITAWKNNSGAGDEIVASENLPANVETDQPQNVGYPPDYTPTILEKRSRFKLPPNDDPSLRRFPCPFEGCTYVAKYRSNLWDHKKTHTGEKPYACNWPSCTMRFMQTHQLKLHIRSHTGERPYSCTWPGCSSAFSQKPGLKSHMLTHSGEKPFKCDYPECGWSFRLKGALTDHKRAIHENGKKHACDWPNCNKRFLQLCHLKKHIMSHANIKPFACDWPDCSYRAVTLAYVTNHRKKHTGEKNYMCTYLGCEKTFVKASHVNRHLQRCHPDVFMLTNEDENEVDVQDEGELGDYEEEAMEIVDPLSRHGMKQSKDQVQIVYVKTYENDDKGEEAQEATCLPAFILQSADGGEEQVLTAGVQLLNGSTVLTSEAGQQFIISKNAQSGALEATPLLVSQQPMEYSNDGQDCLVTHEPHDEDTRQDIASEELDTDEYLFKGLVFN